MSSITQWALVAAVKGVINDSTKDGKVDGMVKATNNLITSFFPGAEKEIRVLLVKCIILPFAKLLLKDDPAALSEAKQHAGI